MLTPDPGWSYNPADGPPLHDARLGAGGRLATSLDPVAGNRPTWRDHGLPERLPRRAPPPLEAAAPGNPDRAMATIRKALGVDAADRVGFTRADGTEEVVFGRVRTPDGLDDVMLSERFVEHLAFRHEGGRRIRRRDGRERHANAIRTVLTDPEEVWLVAERRRGRVVYRRRFLAAFDDDLVGVVQEEKDGGLSWTFDPRLDMNSQRQGFLLYRRRGG